MGVFRVGVDEKGLSLCIELINGKDLGEIKYLDQERCLRCQK